MAYFLEVDPIHQVVFNRDPHWACGLGISMYLAGMSFVESKGDLDRERSHRMGGATCTQAYDIMID